MLGFHLKGNKGQVLGLWRPLDELVFLQTISGTQLQKQRLFSAPSFGGGVWTCGFRHVDQSQRANPEIPLSAAHPHVGTKGIPEPPSLFPDEGAAVTASKADYFVPYHRPLPGCVYSTAEPQPDNPHLLFLFFIVVAVYIIKCLSLVHFSRNSKQSIAPVQPCRQHTSLDHQQTSLPDRDTGFEAELGFFGQSNPSESRSSPPTVSSAPSSSSPSSSPSSLPLSREKYG